MNNQVLDKLFIDNLISKYLENSNNAVLGKFEMRLCDERKYLSIYNTKGKACEKRLTRIFIDDKGNPIHRDVYGEQNGSRELELNDFIHSTQ